MNRNFLMAFALPLLLFTACSKDRVTGSGPMETETRPVSGFTKVKVSGSTPVYITQGSSFEVIIKAYANLLPYMETKVENGELSIGHKPNAVLKNENAVVYIIMPELNGLSTSGSSTIEAVGPFTSDEMKVSISGSSTISIADGTVNDYDIEISGSGTVKSFGLQSRNATVHISGNGEAEISVSDALDVNISGSGILYYKGEPVVESSISGSGKVIKK